MMMVEKTETCSDKEKWKDYMKVLHWTLFIAIQVTHATGCKTQSENSVPAL
jgi:hypothetical protein